MNEMNETKEKLDNFYKKLDSLAGLMNVMSVFVFPGIALYIWKLSQMSDWTRAFSNILNQEMGQGFLVLLVLGFIYIVIGIIYVKSREAFSETRDQYMARLRETLVEAKEDADTQELVHTEAELRKIEGYKAPAPWF